MELSSWNIFIHNLNWKLPEESARKRVVLKDAPLAATEKKCNTCGKVKKVEDFCWKTTNHKRSTQCKKCRAAADKRRRIAKKQ